MTGAELVEIPCAHLRPGDPSVRVNVFTPNGDGPVRHFRLAFCGPCARSAVMGLAAEIDRTFGGRLVGA